MVPVEYTETRAMEIRNQWERFIKGKSVDEKIVRGVILCSWERSRAANVDIAAPIAPMVPPSELPGILEKHASLIKCARPIMQGLFADPISVTTNITLANADGVILYKLKAMDEESNSLMDVGKINTESVIGTSGTGTCIAEKSPVWIFSAEHYSSTLHRFFCHSAPIYDVMNELCGVLSITTLCKNASVLAEKLNATAANAISEQLHMYELLDENEVLMEMLAEGMIVVNAAGNIRSVSKKAAAMLGLRGNATRRHIWDVLKKNSLVESILENHLTIKDQETVLESRDGKQACTCALSSTMLNFNGSIVLAFTEAKRMRAFANQITGAKAVFTFDQIIGDSPQLKGVVEQAQRAARTDVTTLIMGENGTGKELFAQSIHNASIRAQHPFIVVNCGALPKDLVQSELFGYAAGAFTGASKAGQAGKFELAEGGTVFLDEIGEMPLEAQASLLRLLQQKEVTRIGGSRTRKVNVRIIAATNKDLAKAVRNREFREDLYYRLNVFPLIIPPLRERATDIPLLVRHFFKKKQHALPNAATRISPDACRILMRYSWPGNIRELENIIERLMNLVSGREITSADLPAQLLAESPASGAAAGPMPECPAGQRERFVTALRECGGNVRKAAALLNISRNTLYIKIKALGIDLAAFRADPAASTGMRSPLTDMVKAEQLDMFLNFISHFSDIRNR